MKEYLEQYTDLFNIASRVKEIDEGYSLYFNKKTKEFEIHNPNQRGNSLVFSARKVDARIINKLKETRRERAKEFFKKLDEENEKQRQKSMQTIINNASDRLCEIAKYSFIKNRDLEENELKKILNI